jgi:pimeloyl-ACP methyl ester carboxylesterase
MPIDHATGIYFKLDGEGIPLMIGMPLMASHTAIFGAESSAVLNGYLDRLTDGYKVLRVDYPGIGRSTDISPEALTADRAVADILSVADAAGFDRFSYWGYSWSGAVGLQLAARTDRLQALVIGGWPPLEGPVAPLIEATDRKLGCIEPAQRVVLRNDAQYAQWGTFYRSIVERPERAAVEALTIPRLSYFGAQGDLVESGVDVPIASIIRHSRPPLEQAGWEVVEIPGHGHEVAHRPEIVAPIVRDFLDRSVAHHASIVQK